ncbi:HAMP domain-containing protein [Bacillus aquiflavi]|uniref:histidine kinase n=1 Tax=Bacillus aquiflavi TaxID=2672567 RepID=A0A6B3W0V0_9BACI|nr:ATP-binding protein [Bacillus aquiflavi]MBA4537969.1 HAMP domain-containing protein [Bacillus aquiflavi]NEY82225.1 HAMP domain-containing histidine kinase [Bacillus aquiflavi]UAC49878.1 HAMP domain-containing protein [Bacillus aquiflavi]
MKFITNSLAKKLWLTVTFTILITILYSYFLSHIFYERLYVDKIEQSLLDEGNRLALEYEGGPLSDEIREKVEWYNSKSETEVLVVSNPRELSACLPFEIDYETLIGEKERQTLLEGKPIQKIGYEERFDRKIMAVIIPLLDNNRLEGIIYLYLPLESINDLTKDFAYSWLVAAFIFVVIALFFGTKWINRLTKPLKEMKEAAVKVSEGDFSTRVHIRSKDEIGQLGTAFNQMSQSIQKEDERKKEFIANISHELRTPISYVKGYSDALLSQMVKTEEDKQKYLKLIHREAGRLERLVGDLLDLMKFESEEFSLVKMPLPLAQLIEDALQKYISTANEKGIKLTYDLDPELIINGDEGRIEQIFQNLMDNAVRYTESGGTIKIKLFKVRNKCHLVVSDTGIGIKEDDLEKIMQRFYRVNKARTRTDGGTGLGLAIVDQLVKLHNGKLKMTSEYGKGTEVTVILPILNEEKSGC